MNEEQLKKDKELLSSWKEKLVYDAPGSCSFCMSEDEGADDIVTLEDCEELLEAQKRLTEAEVKKQEREYWKKKLEEVLRTGLNPCARSGECGYLEDKCETHYDFVKPTGIVFEDLSPNPEQDGK